MSKLLSTVILPSVLEDDEEEPSKQNLSDNKLSQKEAEV